MDISTLTNLIGSLGFPIACTCAMFFMWNKEREEHKSESEKWAEAVNNNTTVVKELMAKIEEWSK